MHQLRVTKKRGVWTNPQNAGTNARAPMKNWIDVGMPVNVIGNAIVRENAKESGSVVAIDLVNVIDLAEVGHAEPGVEVAAVRLLAVPISTKSDNDHLWLARVTEDPALRLQGLSLQVAGVRVHVVH